MHQFSMFDIGQEPYKIDKPVRLIELFAGIGAQAKALERLGVPFEHYRICEFDKYAVQSYNAIHGTSFETSDITQIGAEDLGIVETDKYEYITTYSFPCTDLSIAGKREGMAKGSGTRSGLLWEVERLLKECKELPQILLMENVPQVLNMDFGEWLEFLESLGYKNYYKILNAKDYGIPQNRQRCYMVSILGEGYYEFPKKEKLTKCLKDLLEEEVDEKYYLSKKQVKTFKADNKEVSNTVRSGGRGSLDKHSWDIIIEPSIVQRPHGYNKGGKKEICPSITTSAFQENNLVKVKEATKKGYGNKALNETLENNSIDDNDFIDAYNRNIRKDGIAGTITTRVNDSNNVFVAKKDKQIKIKNATKKGYLEAEDGDGIDISARMKYHRGTVQKQSAQTITTQANVGVLENTRIRKLTPLECWRLMDFDDIDFYKAKEAGISNSQLYKQAGNSIVVNVLEAIFRELFRRKNE